MTIATVGLQLSFRYGLFFFSSDLAGEGEGTAPEPLTPWTDSQA